MDLREKILEASLELISSRGIGGLSMREVARRLKVTHAAPYHHFKDRSEILAAIAVEGFRRLEHQMRQHVDWRSGPVRRFEACGEAYVAFALESPAAFQVMFRPELAGRKHQARIDKASAGAFQVLDEIVFQCRAEGYGRKLNAKALALTGWSVAHGLAALLIDGPLEHGKSRPQTLSRQVAQTMGALLAATK
jgi:AcrR family transcriptional regulator